MVRKRPIDQSSDSNDQRSINSISDDVEEGVSHGPALGDASLGGRDSAVRLDEVEIDEPEGSPPEGCPWTKVGAPSTVCILTVSCGKVAF